MINISKSIARHHTLTVTADNIFELLNERQSRLQAMNVSNRLDCEVCNVLIHRLDYRMGLRQADDASREVAKTSTSS